MQPGRGQVAPASYDRGVARAPQTRMDLANAFIILLAICAAGLALSAVLGKRAHKDERKPR